MTAQLERTTFTTSRLLEFFTEKELQMQIGHGPRLWPLALVKELVDNALDAGESAGTAPCIDVIVEADAVTVRDNGPGLPATTLQRSLDYAVRVSDKSYYVSPTRGQLGNALKCLWAAPFVATGERGQVTVTTGGTCYQIDVTLDRIAQAPRLEVGTTAAGVVKTGTAITMTWPKVASYLELAAGPDFYNVIALLRNYAAFNPHATLTLTTPAGADRWECTCPDWQKWAPSQPTSPHWYTVDRLGQLIAAYLTAERDGRWQASGRARTVREFVAEFAGLTGSTKPREVATAAGLSGATLRDLACDGDLDRAAIGRLLAAMQGAARPIKPGKLGAVGEEHLTETLVQSFRASPDSVRYKKVEGEQGGVPFVLEVAFGVFTEEYADCGRDIAVGLNWSPSLTPPIRHLPALLGGARVDRHDPVCLVVHIACPRLEYTDKGKTMLGLIAS